MLNVTYVTVRKLHILYVWLYEQIASKYRNIYKRHVLIPDGNEHQKKNLLITSNEHKEVDFQAITASLWT